MVKPTTFYLGEKARQLLMVLANENGVVPRLFITKVLLRDARNSASALTANKLKDRLKLIDEVNEELIDIINNPPKEMLADKEMSANPKSIYSKIWMAHKRLKAQGWSDEKIHEHCLLRYGLDYHINNTPTKSPKRNPDWVGGGANAEKIKKARETSRKIEVK